MILDFLKDSFHFIVQNISYFLTIYILISLYGYYIMKNYIQNCLKNKVIPFGNSVLKMVFVSIVCGLFTTLVIIIGLIMSIVDFFTKKN